MNHKEVLTAKEAAEFLGKSVNAIYLMCFRGSLPHYKAANGKNTYFLLDDLKQWATTIKINSL